MIYQVQYIVELPFIKNYTALPEFKSFNELTI